MRDSSGLSEAGRGGAKWTEFLRNGFLIAEDWSEASLSPLERTELAPERHEI